MIENTHTSSQKEIQKARRKGAAPSTSLRRHFFALARQVRKWSESFDHAPRRNIGVTSLSRGAGKSTVSFNLTCALAASTQSSVLLVEADMGKHYVTRRLGHARAPGLCELITGTAEIHESIFPTPITNVSVLGAGLKSAQEALELPFENLPQVLDDQLSTFRFNIFDLPLANDLTTCHSLAPYLDGVILTVESNQIDRNKIDRVRRQIENSDVEIIGIVLNKA